MSKRPLPHIGISEDDLLKSGITSRGGVLARIYQQYLETEYLKADRNLQARGPLVWGAGDPETAVILFLGEAPGKDENEFKVPFIGPVGQLFSDVLRTAGIDRLHDCFIINTETVAPAGDSPSRIGKPLAADMRMEMWRVREVIEALHRRPGKPLKAIVCLGKYAHVQLLRPDLVDECVATGKPIAKMVDALRMNEIGGWQDDPIKLGVPVLTTYHPSYILRQKQGPRDVWINEANDYLVTFQELRRKVHGR